VCDRIREGGTGEARPRGRKCLLPEVEERHVAARLATHPFAINAEEVAAHNRVKPRTPSRASAPIWAILKSSRQRGRPKCVRSSNTLSVTFRGATE